MAQLSTRLWVPVKLTAAYVVLYTSTNSRTKNLWITSTNPTAVTYTVTIALVESGGAETDANTLTFQRTVLPGQTVVFYEFCGHNMSPGDFISAKASTADKVNLMGSGEVTTK